MAKEFSKEKNVWKLKKIRYHIRKRKCLENKERVHILVQFLRPRVTTYGCYSKGVLKLLFSLLLLQLFFNSQGT